MRSHSGNLNGVSSRVEIAGTSTLALLPMAAQPEEAVVAPGVGRNRVGDQLRQRIADAGNGPFVPERQPENRGHSRDGFRTAAERPCATPGGHHRRRARSCGGRLRASHGTGHEGDPGDQEAAERHDRRGNQSAATAAAAAAAEENRDSEGAGEAAAGSTALCSAAGRSGTDDTTGTGDCIRRAHAAPRAASDRAARPSPISRAAEDRAQY